jgi:hypothetical protein
VRIASRHPGPVEDNGIERIVADVHDRRLLEAAVAGVDGVVNTVSLYVEHGRETFWSVHVEGGKGGAPRWRQAVGAPVRNWRHCKLGFALYSQSR